MQILKAMQCLLFTKRQVKQASAQLKCGTCNISFLSNLTGCVPQERKEMRGQPSDLTPTPCVWFALGPFVAGLLLSASLKSTSGMPVLLMRCTQQMDSHAHTSVLLARACTPWSLMHNQMHSLLYFPAPKQCMMRM